MVLVVWEKLKLNPPKHPQQLLFLQVCPKTDPRGRPCSRPTPGSLWCLDLTQMVLAAPKKLKSTHLNIPNNFCFNNFAQINPSGRPCSRPTPGSLWCLNLTQMVLAIRKKLKSTLMNMPKSFCFNNFAQKSIPGDVRAQVLQVPVGAVFWVWASPRWSWPSGKR